MIALNLQTAFLAPVAMAVFYLKGVALLHVSLNQIFAMFLRYVWPDIALWLPAKQYK